MKSRAQNELIEQMNVKQMRAYLIRNSTYDTLLIMELNEQELREAMNEEMPEEKKQGGTK